MADDQQQHVPGGHYSGQNKIPTVNKFLQNLDRNKKQRDAQIDEELRQQKPASGTKGSDAVPHAQTSTIKGAKSVTDPVTGNQVEIADVGKDFVRNAREPKLSVPNANLDKSTPVKTDPYQANPEYKEKQDITSPPDPVAEGSTSDVPIQGEKTNILFHPTPSVSYEPMYARLEKQASGICAFAGIAIIVLGKMFGGSLKGLIPLAACIVSGFWLWMKELVRSGREVEW